ncbi:hypothetical protein QR680_009917 [Steinernema hermaphroditum]|uniref:Glucuronosyltransferase n=1 Tax=Steinernema hermaphroditum TaxID=289476 RepID=A0AA39INF6_9BILA|nr:hypothetical protein QR680_009917 [Steinernema hermaphroditum]
MALIYLFFAIAAILFYVSKKLGKGLPPGPTPIPLLGNALQFIYGGLQGKTTVDVMREWTKKYGKVYTVWMGPMPIVLICDYQITMDAFVKNGEAHAGRTQDFVFTETREGYNGVVFNDGIEWQEQRRFSLHTLRNFGVGRNIMQAKILEEAQHRFDVLDAQIEANNGRVVMNPSPFFDLMIGSIVNKLLAGYRYDEKNMDEFFRFKHSIDAAFGNFTMFDTAVLNKFTYNLPLFKQRWDFLCKPMLEVRSLMKRQIKERVDAVASGKHALDLDSEGEDYIEAYLIEMEKRKQSGKMGSFHLEYLASNLMDLWMAGMETTISTLLWSFVFFVNHPETQEKVRDEVLSVTKGNRDVGLADKPSLPYTNAVITEVLRCGNVLNFNLLHRTTTETIVGDYFLPKGTIITSQQSVILTWEEQFKEAQKFNPERYLDDNKLEKQVISFGVGKRACLGESLARAELFLIISNFVQRYKISPADGVTPPSMEQLNGASMTKRVIPFEVAVEKVI